MKYPCPAHRSWNEGALMAGSYQTFIIRFYQTPYKKMTVKLSSSAKQPALYPVSHHDLGKTVTGWLQRSLNKTDKLLLVWANQRTPRQPYFGTSEFFHHEEGIISSVIVIIIVVGWGSPFCTLPWQSSSSSGVERVYNNWLRAFDFTAAKRTTLALWFLQGRGEICYNHH